MKNEFVKKYVGESCEIIVGQASFTENVSGKIIQIAEQWMEVETKKGIELLNIDFINSIKIKK